MISRFTLQPVAPFSLELTAWLIRRDGRNNIDLWDGTTYSRVVPVGDGALLVKATQDGSTETPRLGVEVSSARQGAHARQLATDVLNKTLGLELNLDEFYHFAARQPRLRELARQFRGVKPPRFPSVWEALVNAISCQQLSLTVGMILMNRLSERFGLRAGSQRALPRPEDLADARPGDLREMGYNNRKAGTILDLAKAAAAKEVDLESVAAMDDEAAVDFLTGLTGIGRWSAQYVLLRGLGRLNVFPADDVGFQNKLTKWLHLQERLDYEGVNRAVRRWRAYSGILYFFMLLNHLFELGRLGNLAAAR